MHRISLALALGVTLCLMVVACGDPPVISLTALSTVSPAKCGDTKYRVSTILTNQSSVDILVSTTAPTQVELTVGTLPGGRIAAGGSETLVTTVTLDDVCTQGELGLLFRAEDASVTPLAAPAFKTDSATVLAQPLRLAQLAPRSPVPADAAGNFHHSMSFGCCAAGASEVVWVPPPLLGADVMNVTPAPGAAQGINCAGPAAAPLPTGLVAVDGMLSQGASIGLSGHEASTGRNKCEVLRPIERQAANEEDAGAPEGD